MPLYTYSHPTTKETIEVVQRMTESHVYFDAQGVEWQRVFTIPQASIDTTIDPLSSKDFVEKTGKKRGTLGNIMDASREASDKRKQLMGKDPVKQQYWDNYAKKRKGRRHPKSFED
jgi:hypothetical protein